MQAEIKGTTMPVLEVTLQPGEQLISAHGELSWMIGNMQMSQTTGGGLLQGLRRQTGPSGLNGLNGHCGALSIRRCALSWMPGSCRGRLPAP
jgi:hypothetical protein